MHDMVYGGKFAPPSRAQHVPAPGSRFLGSGNRPASADASASDKKPSNFGRFNDHDVEA